MPPSGERISISPIAANLYGLLNRLPGAASSYAHRVATLHDTCKTESALSTNGNFQIQLPGGFSMAAFTPRTAARASIKHATSAMAFPSFTGA